MQAAPNYFDPVVTARNLTIARRTNALIRYVAPGSSLSEVMPPSVAASFEDRLDESFCGGGVPTSPRLGSAKEGTTAPPGLRSPGETPTTPKGPIECREAVEAAVEAAVAEGSMGGSPDPQCCIKCSRTFLREAEVLKRVQHMLNLLANLSRGDLEVLRGLIDAKLAASVPEVQTQKAAGPASTPH